MNEAVSRRRIDRFHDLADLVDVNFVRKLRHAGLGRGDAHGLEQAHRALDEALPGDGSLAERYQAWRDTSTLAGDQLAPEYLALNPNGVVPTLVHDGEVITDSSVIIEYLDEVASARESFTPQAPAERARMRALMRFIDEVPAAAVRVPT